MTTEIEKLHAADMSRFHFARLSTQYYVLGRAAALHHQMPVLGNLLHHAVEMALKAALAYQIDLKAMKKKLSHCLPKIWEQFLALNPHLDATEHTRAIERLHTFEELRYPDSMVANGGMIQFALFRHEVDALRSIGKYCKSGPTYLLVLEDIDALIAFIFKSAELSLEEHLDSRAPEVLGLLRKHNRHLPAR
jgi:hypothetical protein